MKHSRTSANDLMCEYTSNLALRAHMYAVETAMRAYAQKFDEDVEKWGIVGLLHDFDYERWPSAPDHPLKGAEILTGLGYPDDIIYAIKSHVDCIDDCPRVNLMDKALFASDELSGFLVACAKVRPDGFVGMKAKSVRKKMKTKSFAAAVPREDLIKGAEDLNVELNEHIEFVVAALAEISDQLL